MIPKSVQSVICAELYEDLSRVSMSKLFQNARNKSFLITGGAGFIAYHVALVILIANDILGFNNNITLLIRDRNKAIQRYGILLKRDDIHLLEQDVCSPIPYKDVSFDYIIHAASSADPQHFAEDPIGVFDSNVLGVKYLLQRAFEDKSESVVFISSFTVYGEIEKHIKEVTEEYKGIVGWNDKQSCYPYGKRCAEFICFMAYAKYGVPVKIIRPGFVYGASSLDDSRVYAEIISSAARNKDIILRSSGSLCRSMIYVTDLINGLFTVLLNGKNGEAYNIAAEHISIRKFAEIASEINTHSSLYFINKNDVIVQHDPCSYGAMSIKKIHRECGWNPMVSIVDGIRMSIEIYRYMYLDNFKI